MALPLVPALGGLAKSLGLGGAFAGGSQLVRQNFGRVSGWLGRNTGRTGAGVIGGGAGVGIASIMQRLGIEDTRLQNLTIIGVFVGGVVAVGQLINFDIEV